MSRAIGLFIVGVVGIFIAAVAALDLGRAVVAQDVEGISGNLTAFLVIALVFGVLIWLGTLILPYALQDQRGRRLLWLAFLAAILAQAAVMVYGITAMSPEGLSDSTELQGILANIELLGHLQAVPAVLKSWAYGHAWTRLRAGEIPEVPSRPIPG